MSILGLYTALLDISMIFASKHNEVMNLGSNPTANFPHILVLGMGGTIAGIAPDPDLKPNVYHAGELSINALLEGVSSSIPDSLKLVSGQVANIDSRNLSEDLLTTLGNRVLDSLSNPLVQGIVITHGTDTVEETGFFLSAVCGKLAEKIGKRVVLTGAMLPANAAQADGPQNLLDALKWAARDSDDCPGGVFAVFAGKVCLARDLAKRHTDALSAPLMDSPTSPISLINPSWMSRLRAIEAATAEDLAVPQDWPWVEIVTSHSGARPELIQSLMDLGVQGLVMAGTGHGGLHEAWSEILVKAANQGIALVRASRTGAGAVEGAYGLGVSAGSLSAPRARIALQLALNATKRDKSLTWQDFFARMAVLPEFR
jgi:L-asparaginase